LHKYIAKRLLMMLPTLVGAAILVFFLLRAIPGDVCEVRLAGSGLYVDEAEIELCREKLGLAKPLIVQFFDFITGYFTWDLGDSMWTGKPVTEEIAIRFPLSLQVAIMATVVAVVFAIPLGAISAIKQDTWIDYVVRTFSIAGIAMPSFWLGILIILGLLIGTQHFLGTPWMPPITYVPLYEDPMANLSTDLACSRDGLSLFSGSYPYDTISPAGSSKGGLHSHRSRKRHDRKNHHQSACAEELDAAGVHDHRY
jgi:peptide/nickel transport system permease protein